MEEFGEGGVKELMREVCCSKDLLCFVLFVLLFVQCLK